MQFDIKALLVVTAAVAFSLWWWLPMSDDVRRLPIWYWHWQPSTADDRLTSREELEARLGGTGSQLDDWDDFVEGPDFSTSDVVPVPLNGLAGEPTAKFRMKELGQAAEFQLQGTPLVDAVDSIEKQFDVYCDLDIGPLAEAGVDTETPVYFEARGEPLREALARLLAPLDLTYVIHSETLIVTTRAQAESAEVEPLVSSPWDRPYVPELNSRTRISGWLVFVTSFADDTEIDSRAIAYTVPKGATVVFVTETVANSIDVGFAMLMIGGIGLAIVWSRRNRRYAG